MVPEGQVVYVTKLSSTWPQCGRIGRKTTALLSGVVLSSQQFLAEFKDASVMGFVVLSELNIRILVDLFQAMNGAVLRFFG